MLNSAHLLRSETLDAATDVWLSCDVTAAAKEPPSIWKRLHVIATESLNGFTSVKDLFCFFICILLYHQHTVCFTHYITLHHTLDQTCHWSLYCEIIRFFWIFTFFFFISSFILFTFLYYFCHFYVCWLITVIKWSWLWLIHSCDLKAQAIQML